MLAGNGKEGAALYFLPEVETCLIPMANVLVSVTIIQFNDIPTSTVRRS